MLSIKTCLIFDHNIGSQPVYISFQSYKCFKKHSIGTQYVRTCMLLCTRYKLESDIKIPWCPDPTRGRLTLRKAMIIPRSIFSMWTRIYLLHKSRLMTVELESLSNQAGVEFRLTSSGCFLPPNMKTFNQSLDLEEVIHMRVIHTLQYC